jgi:hypothetical protein
MHACFVARRPNVVIVVVVVVVGWLLFGAV